MSKLFEYLQIKNIKIDEWDVSNAEDMSFMFNECNVFEGIGLENWDTSNVTNMTKMFHACKLLNPDLSSWGTHVSNVKNMRGMFSVCRSFEGTELEKWNISNVY